MTLAIPLHFVTPVWGVEYTRTFVAVMLPCLLSPGNIPSLRNARDCVYKIYTTSEDARTIVSSPAYTQLAKYMPVSIGEIATDETNKYFASSLAYREAAIAASREGAAGVFLGPDVIVADGGVRSAVRVLEGGKSAVLVMGVRAIKESLVPEVLGRFSREGHICVSPGELVEALLRHLHPISQSHLYDGESANFHPAGFFWKVANEGLLMHCFHLHPVVVFGPAISTDFSTTIDNDLLQNSGLPPSSVHIVTDSDEMLFVEVSPARYTVPTPKRAGAKEIASFIASSTNAFHRETVKVAIRMHVGAISEEIWLRVEERASRVVASVLLAHEALGKSSRAFSVIQPARALELGAQGYLRRHAKDARHTIPSAAKLAAAHVITSVFSMLRRIRNSVRSSPPGR